MLYVISVSYVVHERELMHFQVSATLFLFTWFCINTKTYTYPQRDGWREATAEAVTQNRNRHCQEGKAAEG